MVDRQNVNPDKAQFRAFLELPRDAPVNMLNLVRLLDEAQYDDGRTLSGHEAYALYGQHSAPVFQRVGGSILWRGSMECMLIGPVEEHWDHCFIAQYPSAAAFLEMLADPAYQAAVVHRTAAVADSRLVRLGPADGTGGFAG